MSASATSAACSVKTEQKGHAVAMRRMMGLETASEMLGGKKQLAYALAIEGRSLRYKLTGDRGVSSDDLTSAADALDARAARIVEHARKLRDEAAA